MKHLLVALALTYLMPAYSVLRRTAATRDELTTTAVKAEGRAGLAPVTARSMASALGVTWVSGELSMPMTLSVRWPGRCRLDLMPDGGKAVVIASSNGKLRTEGPQLKAAEVAVTELCALLALKSGGEGETRAALESHLKDLKVDTRQVGLGRFEGGVTWVLGDKADGAARFEVYKDRFLPARVRIPDAAGPWDVRFVDYTSQATGDWLPRVVEVWQGAELQFRLNVLAADGHASLESVKF